VPNIKLQSTANFIMGAAQQLTQQQPVTSGSQTGANQDHLMTPYGAPSPQAYVLPVPNEVVGLIIGRGGETIRALQVKSGAKI
jgi:hypothetical protein